MTVFFGKHSANCGGFTLVELVVAAVLLGILASVGSSMISDSFLVARYLNKENEAASAARYAIERVGREIRELQPGSITAFTANELRFSRAGTAVTVSFQGGRVAIDSVAITTSSPTLIAPVTSMAFFYYDQNGTLTTDRTKIRFVDVDLTVTPSDGRPIRLLNRIAIRNQT